MSLLIKPLPQYIVEDPRTEINEQRTLIIEREAQAWAVQAIPASSSSNSQSIWNVTVSSNKVILQRQARISCTFSVSVTGADQGSPLFEIGSNDAPRQFPLSSVIQTIQLQVNNQTFTCNISDYVHALMRYNFFNDKANVDYSSTPSFPDQDQLYSQSTGAMNNPLGSYADQTGFGPMPRGGWDITVATGATGNPNTSQIATFTVYEDLFISPLLSGKESWMKSGLYDLTQFNITLTYGDLNRVWSHSSAGKTFATISTTIASPPSLQLFQGTPNELVPKPKLIPYDYWNMTVYPLNATAFLTGASQTLTTQNLQLQQIPESVYLFCRQQDSDRTYLTSDAFFRLNSVSIFFDNRQGLLSSASAEQLYEISVSNGLQMSWTQYNSHVGAVFAFKMKDIGLDILKAPGLAGNQYNLQITANFTNINPGTITPQVFVVVAQPGVMTSDNTNGSIQLQQGVITPQDLVNSANLPQVSKALIEKPYSSITGGDFLQDLGRFAKGVFEHVKQNKAVSNILKQIPNPYAQMAVPVAEALGVGLKKKKKAGSMIGGADISRDMLRARLLR